MSIEDDAVALICWYESQPNCETRKKDHQIAEALNWFVGGFSHRKRWTKKDGHGKVAPPDKARVRTTRRWIDRNDIDPAFADYHFGTRMTGGGTTYSRLSRRGLPSQVTVDDAVWQLATADQAVDRFSAENVRRVDKLKHLVREFEAADEMAKAFAVHSAACDLESDGRLREQTKVMLADAGIEMEFS